MDTREKFSAMNTPMNRQVIFMFLVLIGMQFINKIDFENPTNKMYLFITYGVAQSITILAGTLIYFKIKQKNDKGIIHLKNTGMMANAQAAVDKDADENEVITQTVMEYDLSKCKQMFSNVAITIALSGFLYYKFQIIKPLAIQSIFAIKNLLEQPLVMIHLFGRPATGELARPFKSGNFLAPKEEVVTDKDYKRMEKKKN